VDDRQIKHAPIAIDRAGLRFTVLDGHRAVDFLGCSAG